MTQWQLIYHGMLSVTNLHRELGGIHKSFSESSSNHECSKLSTAKVEIKLGGMIEYIQANENPAKITETTDIRLHNIISNEIASD